MKHYRKLCEHILIAVSIHNFLADVAAQNHAGICCSFIIANREIALFKVAFESCTHLICICERNRQHFIQSDKITARN